MQTKFIIAAALSALAAPASAAPHGTPYALGAVHADVQAQLEEVAGMPGGVGEAARATADLMVAQCGAGKAGPAPAGTGECSRDRAGSVGRGSGRARAAT
jgi:hypothetical protein